MIAHDLPFADYLALPSEHFSTLKALDLSPLHYRRAVDHPIADNDALRIGRITHAMILTPDAPTDVAVWDGAVRRGKAWDAFEAENVGKTIVRAADLAGAEAMRAAVYAHPFARSLLSSGAPEVTATWEVNGIACRCRVDWLRDDGAVVELKTTRHVGPRAFMSEFAKRLYHAQVAFYEDGIAANGVTVDGPSSYVIAVEKDAPHDVCVYRIDSNTIEVGRRKLDDWMTALAECRASGRWPGASDGVIDMVLPDWAVTDGLEDVDVSNLEGSDE